MGKLGKYVVMFLVVGIVGFVFSAVVGSLLSIGTIAVDGMMSAYTWSIWGLVMLGFIIYVLSKAADGKSLVGEGKKKEAKPKDQYFDSQWLSERDMNKKYDFSFFKELHAHKDGIPIRAQLVGGNIKVNLVHENWHVMVIGTTGSGKTAGFVDPCIQILSSTKTKPCLVIMDVKGELFLKHANKLRSEGYNIKALDLRNAFASTRWNPMEKAYRAFHRSLKLTQEVVVHVNENPADLGLKVIAPVYNNEWYEFQGVAYPSRSMLDNDLNALRKQLNDQAYEDLNDIAITLCPIEGQDPSWSRGAKDFVLGTMLAMLEDSAIPELGMTMDRFNFFNLYKICNTRDASADKQFETLSKYFEGRSRLSSAATLAKPIVNNAPVTARSFFGLVAQDVSMFADGGMCFVTSADEMDFEHFADQPTAMFIKVPDEKETRHPIATMCVLQLYKTLVDSASHMPGLRLPRNVYFILDEFGNLPKIPRFESIITVGRSRGISLMLVIQSYPQVNIKYGEAAADTIKSNCNIHVFLGTTDPSTKEEFSKRCGNVSVETTSSSESKGKEGNNKSTTTSTSSRPLIYPDELGLLKEGEMIVSMFKESPIRSQFTFAYKASHIYNMQSANEEYVPARSLNEEKVFYDIKERNRKILGGSGDLKF